MSSGRKKSKRLSPQDISSDSVNQSLLSLRDSLKTYNGVHRMIVNDLRAALFKIPVNDIQYLEKRMDNIVTQIDHAMKMDRRIFGKKSEIDLQNSLLPVLAQVQVLVFNRVSEPERVSQASHHTKKTSVSKTLLPRKRIRTKLSSEELQAGGETENGSRAISKKRKREDAAKSPDKKKRL